MESRDHQILAESKAFDSALNFAYPIPQTDTTLLNRNLKNWIEDSNRYDSQDVHPLDRLYKIIKHR